MNAVLIFQTAPQKPDEVFSERKVWCVKSLPVLHRHVIYKAQEFDTGAYTEVIFEACDGSCSRDGQDVQLPSRVAVEAEKKMQVV